MIKVYIEAYDKNQSQILGNMDGQGVIRAKMYKRTNHYKGLSSHKTLDNIVSFYRVVNENGDTLETVINNTCL